MTTISIQIRGDKELFKKLEKIQGELKNIRQPLAKVSTFMKQRILENFARSGAYYGGWKALRAKSYEAKIKQGFGGQGPLVRTGAMRGNFQFVLSTNQLTIFNPIDYFKFHQLGTRKMPQRMMMDIREPEIKETIKDFEEWLNNLLK